MPHACVVLQDAGGRTIPNRYPFVTYIDMKGRQGDHNVNRTGM